jgi:hypothetical protein
MQLIPAIYIKNKDSSPICVIEQVSEQTYGVYMNVIYALNGTYVLRAF